MVGIFYFTLLGQNDLLVVKDSIFKLILQEVLNWSVAVNLAQFFEFQSVVQVIVVSSSAQKVLSHLLARLEEVLLEGAVSGFLKVLVLNVLQVGSLLGRVDVFSTGLDGLSLGLDAVNDIFGSVADLIHEAGVAGGLVSLEFVIRAGLKSFTTESRVVHEDGLEVFERVLAGVSEDSEVKDRSVGARKSETSVRARDIESSEERIFEVVELKDESVVVLEEEDTKGSNGTKDGGVASHLLDFGFFEEEGFNTLGGAR